MLVMIGRFSKFFIALQGQLAHLGGCVSILLTKSAVDAVVFALEERGKGMGIRLEVQVTSQSRIAFRLAFADEVNDDDLCFEQEGIHVFVSMKYLSYLDGLLIDYKEDYGERGFSIEHIDSCNSCGCGHTECAP